MKKTTTLLGLLLAIILVPNAYAATLNVLSTEPAPPVSGEYTEITVRFNAEGIDQPLHNVEITPTQTNLVTPITPQKTFDALGAADTVTTTFRVYIDEDTPQGNLPVRFTVRSDDATFTYDPEIYVRGDQTNPDLRIASITTTPQDVLPDTEDTEIAVTVNNLGERDAEQISTELRVDGITESYAYSLEDQASTIAAYDEHTFTYVFDTPRDIPDTLNGVVETTYRIPRENAPDRVETTELPIRIPVKDAPFLEITNISGELLTAGTTDNDVTLTITNTGSGEAEDVRARLFPDVSYPFLFDATTKYVTTSLQPGDSTTIAFTVETLGDAQIREYPVTFELESLVGTNRYEREDTATLRVIGTSADIQSYAPYIVVVVVLIAAGIIGYTMKKKD